MNSAAFARAEAYYLSPPEVSPAQEAWEQGREEIAEFYQDASDILENLGCECVDGIDSLDTAIDYLKSELASLEQIRDDVAELEDKYPAADWEPDFDGWDEE